MPKKNQKKNQTTKIVIYLTSIAASIAIVTGIVKGIVWFDDYYVDQDEAITFIEKVTESTNKNLKTINSNIIFLGNAFYDQRIAEIESLISDVIKIENKNQTEVQFLESLKRDRLELQRQQEILQHTIILPVSN